MINYKYKKNPIMTYQSYLSSIPQIKTTPPIIKNNANNINVNQNEISNIKDFTFDEFKSHPQILIIGPQEYNTTEILKMIMKKLKNLVNTSNTTVYTGSYKNAHYTLPSTTTCYSYFNSSTIESILASQMDTPDEQYSNKWQNFDTCINIFDRCFSESEYNFMYSSQFEKMSKYNKSYKIINIIIVNYMYDGFISNKFDYIFCTNDGYTLNVDRIWKSLSLNVNLNFYWVFDKCATKESALVIQTKENLCIFERLKYCFLIEELETKEDKKINLICFNDSILSTEKIKSIEI